MWERKVNEHKGAAWKRKLLLPGGTVLWRVGDKSMLSPLAGVAPDLSLLSWGIPGIGADAACQGVPWIALKSVKSCEFAVKCFLLKFKGLINVLKWLNYIFFPFFLFSYVKLVFKLFPGPIFHLAPRLSLIHLGSPLGDLYCSNSGWLCRIFLLFAWLGFWCGFGGLFFFNLALLNIK